MNSYPGFWESELGQRYLALQRDAIQRKVKIRRVFVVESDTMDADPTFRRICRDHADTGVEVRLLNPSTAPRVTRSLLFD